ncbi:MAG: hypothetical protein Q4G42_01620 [Neisseria sp.]|nr:hypothetical protein [Neisseria sp.]
MKSWIKITGLLSLMLNMAVAGATCPFFDSIQYKGQYLSIDERTPFPQSEKYWQWVQDLSWCSAHNQGAPQYQIIGQEVFLVGFSACGESPDLSELYPDEITRQGLKETTPKIKATFLNGSIYAYGGEKACWHGMCAVLQDEWIFEIENGNLKWVTQHPNPNAAELCER